jgi:hypothetical protein
MLARLGLREYQDFKRVVINRGIYTIVGTTIVRWYSNRFAKMESRRAPRNWANLETNILVSNLHPKPPATRKASSNCPLLFHLPTDSISGWSASQRTHPGER